MNPAYVMGYMAEISVDRVEAYKVGTLDVDDIVLLYQDLLESGMLPPAWLPVAIGMLENGLLYARGRALQ